jgi:hypothetical protein
MELIQKDSVRVVTVFLFLRVTSVIFALRVYASPDGA